MTNTYYLDSNNYDSLLLKLIDTIQRTADQHTLSIFLLGATARDIVMTTFHGAAQQRATLDVDFGICVSDWKAFETLKTSLIEQGFSAGKAAHRLVSPDRILVDIVPYGELSTKGKVEWPPNGDIQMSVLGFTEASNAALLVNMPESGLCIKVASPVGITLLKLLSWAERDLTNRKKDAVDIAFLANNYYRLPMIETRSFEESIVEMFDYNLQVAGAYCLGLDVIELASTESNVVIDGILARTHNKNGIEKFKEEANPISASVQSLSEALDGVLNAFESGLRNK